MDKKLNELREFLIESIYEIKSEKLGIKKAKEISRMTFALCQVYNINKDTDEK